ncbi:hypothetical protein HYU14_01545 [Candidatus Woesearchaeota archaeon]|nr:hypothetical protein [Candidatus Woesearchaeota archaeon]
MKAGGILLVAFFGLAFALLISLYALIEIVEGGLAGTQNVPKPQQGNLNIFFAPQKLSGIDQLKALQQETAELRKMNNLGEERDLEVGRCIRKLTKNWRRNIDARSFDGKIVRKDSKSNVIEEFDKAVNRPGTSIYGFDESLDRDFRKRLEKKFDDGGRVC